MQQRLPYISIRPFFPHAVVATVAVCVLPALAVLAYAGSDPSPSLVTMLLLGVGLTLAATAIGTLLWHRRPESSDISFGELIMWSWLRRRWAERRLQDDVDALGIDVSDGGRPSPFVEPAVQVQLLHDLSRALEIKDPYTHGHSRRVERHVRRTAEAMGLSEAEIAEAAQAAAMHDVGKIRVADRMLRKPGSLTIDELVRVQEHSTVGAEMVSLAGSRDVTDGIRHHHERWDGNGYPDGLAGRTIPLYARLIAVADAYDAMVSTRPYRAGLGHSYALQVLREESGSQFDPEVVEAFIETMPARIPAAAFLPLFAYPSYLLRRLAVPVRRLALTNVSPGIAAMGAAVIVGASLTPPAPSRPAPRVAAPPMVEEVEATDTTPERTKVRPRVKPARVRKVETPPSAPAPPTSDVPEEQVLAGDEVRSPKPDPKPDPEPVPQPAPEPPDVPQDPQPVKGRDCVDHPGKGNGKGHALHC